MIAFPFPPAGSLEVRRLPYSNRRLAIFGYRSGRTLFVTDVGWSILRCDDDEEKVRLCQEVHLLHDLDVEKGQLLPFKETLEAFGVGDVP